MRKILFGMMLVLVIVGVLALAFRIHHERTPVAMTSPESSSTEGSSGVTASVEPVMENVNPIPTVVNPISSKAKPLVVAGNPVESGSSALPWQYVLIAIVVAILSAATLAMPVLKRRKHKSSRIRFLNLMILAGLLMISMPQVCGQENSTVTIWDLGSIDIPYPTIARESVDSAGNVWFGTDVGYMICCLNPTTSELKKWTMPDYPGVATAVSVDNAGRVWFTDVHHQKVGRFDPSTNFFTIWSVPGIGAYKYYRTGGFRDYRALPTVSTDSHGRAYFPEYLTNKIGRIDPATNELTEWIVPTDESEPCYTMVDSDDNVWFAEFSGNKIGRLNPHINEITEWPIPTPDSYPSGLFAATGLIYFTESYKNKIGRLDPSTNEMTQWSTEIPFDGVFYQNPFGLFVDLNGNAWFVNGDLPYWCALFRLDTNNVMTYWDFPIGPTGKATGGSLGVTVDAKMNVGDVYVATGWRAGGTDYWDHCILRFRPEG